MDNKTRAADYSGTLPWWNHDNDWRRIPRLPVHMHRITDL